MEGSHLKLASMLHHQLFVSHVTGAIGALLLYLCCVCVSVYLYIRTTQQKED